MKLLRALFALSATAPTTGFTIFHPGFARALPTSPAAFRLSASVESDFASAMPEKPEQTFSDRMVESATQFIAQLEASLGDDVTPPPELEALREARDSPNTEVTELVQRVYELMIEQSMLYDLDPETGKRTPTEWNIIDNLEEPQVKSEFDYLYKYGMNLATRGLMDVDVLKEIVSQRLIPRTGKTPEEFDAWLGY